jgi:flavin-dependent dehydrogenase
VGLGLRRESLDHILLRKAEREGVTIFQGVRPREIAFDRGRWTIRWGGEDGRLSAAVLVGADGRNSWTAERLGVDTERASGRVAFQLQMIGVGGIEREVQVHIFPGGYAGLIGLGNAAANLCFSVERTCLRSSGTIEELMARSLFRNRRLKEALETAERTGAAHSAYPVFFSPRKSSGEGFVLVGDAARVTEPVTGEGVYFALKGGELAAEAIDQAFARGDFSSRALSAYGRACREAFGVRSAVNRAVRSVVYRPGIVRPAITLSSKMSWPIAPLVRWLCRVDSSGDASAGGTNARSRAAS